ncbi:MAG: hypothetical protein AAF483_25720, partial [Planctomycetota bacterium]
MKDPELETPMLELARPPKPASDPDVVAPPIVAELVEKEAATDFSPPQKEDSSTAISKTDHVQSKAHPDLIPSLDIGPSQFPPPVDSNLQSEVTAELQMAAEADALSELQSGQEQTSEKKFAWYLWPAWLLGRSWDMACLGVLLAVVAAVPVLQLASLGYLLVAAANLAQRRPWRSAFPGLRLAGKLGTFALLGALAWLPVWLVTDLSYSAQLLQPRSGAANGWRIGAFLITTAWLVHLSWAAIRGGRWWHFLWPAPLRFVREIWRPSTWGKASDELYELVASLQIPRLWWLGARSSAGVLLWIFVPVSMMIVGLRSDDVGLPGLVGFVGAIGMIAISLYLPFLQIQMAVHNRFASIFDVLEVRRLFRFAPIAHALALMLLIALCIPLYLLR